MILKKPEKMSNIMSKSIKQPLSGRNRNFKNKTYSQSLSASRGSFQLKQCFGLKEQTTLKEEALRFSPG